MAVISGSLLQGGRFDCADRLFWSVAEAYAGAGSGTNDVKELVPEWSQVSPSCLQMLFVFHSENRPCIQFQSTGSTYQTFLLHAVRVSTLAVLRHATILYPLHDGADLLPTHSLYISN